MPRRYSLALSTVMLTVPPFIVLTTPAAAQPSAEAQLCPEKSISLDLQQADARSAISVIADICRFQYVLDPEITTRVTLSLRNVTASDAFRALLWKLAIVAEIQPRSAPAGSPPVVIFRPLRQD